MVASGSASFIDLGDVEEHCLDISTGKEASHPSSAETSYVERFANEPAMMGAVMPERVASVGW